jgi:MFS family permease
VYIGIYIEEFHISPTVASGLVNFPNLSFGFGALILVPLFYKLGRRPIMLLSMLFYCSGLLGCAVSQSYSSLMACRVLHTLGSGICEVIPIALVNDIFFIHERGKKLGWYTVCLCLGSTGPLYAGYMLSGGYSWRLFFWVEFAFGVALLIATFLFVEETRYKRVVSSPPSTPTETKEANASAIETTLPPRKTLRQRLSLWSGVDHDAPFLMMALRSFTYYLVPVAVWVNTTYGIFIALGALTFNLTFPYLIVEEPYNWSQTNSGLIAVASMIGFFIAIPLTPASDILAAKLTKRNGGIREAEMRLGALLPPMVIAPAGLAVYGCTAQFQLHWIGYFAGVAMCQFGAYFYFTYAMAYAVDSYSASLPELLIATNLGKSAISFGMGYGVIEWINQRGYATVVAGIYMAVLLANNMVVLVFMFFGKRIRIFMHNSWVGRMHQKAGKQY